MLGSGNLEDTYLISVGSEIYPGLLEYYNERTEAWVMGDSPSDAGR